MHGKEVNRKARTQPWCRRCRRERNQWSVGDKRFLLSLGVAMEREVAVREEGNGERGKKTDRECKEMSPSSQWKWTMALTYQRNWTRHTSKGADRAKLTSGWLKRKVGSGAKLDNYSKNRGNECAELRRNSKWNPSHSLYKVQHRLPLPHWDFWSTNLSSLPRFPKAYLCPYFPPCSVWILCFIPKTTFLHNVQVICPHSLYFPGKTSTLMKLYRPTTSPHPNSLPAPLSSGMRLGKDCSGAHPAEIPEPRAPPCSPAHCQCQVSLFLFLKETNWN